MSENIKNLRNVDNFILDEYSICREERQYALFLYNYICSLHNDNSKQAKNVKEKLFGSSEVIIRHVFYEVTFMRDFFEQDRRISSLEYPDVEKVKNIIKKKKPKCLGKQWARENRFNLWLLKYIKEKTEEENIFKKSIEDFIEEVQEYHLGARKGQKELTKFLNPDVEEKIKNMVRVLMNSKPDIAVVYEAGTDTYLQFFECKFESKESDNQVEIPQTKAQDLIAGFLTDFSEENPYQIAKKYKNTKIIQFDRENTKEDDSEKIYFVIDELITKHKNIFGF